jgi:hypothetical protein
MDKSEKITNKIILCDACKSNHRLTIACKYEISFSHNPFSRKKKSDSQIQYPLIYTCPIRDMLMQIELTFDNSSVPQFSQATIVKVENCQE